MVFRATHENKLNGQRHNAIFPFYSTDNTSITILNEAQIEALARLARIRLERAEIPALTQQLGQILALVERMNAIDTTGVEPLAHPLDIVPRQRPDVVSEHDQRAALLAIAPVTDAGYYLVPRVVE